MPRGGPSDVVPNASPLCGPEGCPFVARFYCEFYFFGLSSFGPVSSFEGILGSIQTLGLGLFPENVCDRPPVPGGAPSEGCVVRRGAGGSTPCLSDSGVWRSAPGPVLAVARACSPTLRLDRACFSPAAVFLPTVRPGPTGWMFQLAQLGPARLGCSDRFIRQLPHPVCICCFFPRIWPPGCPSTPCALSGAGVSTPSPVESGAGLFPGPKEGPFGPLA